MIGALRSRVVSSNGTPVQARPSGVITERRDSMITWNRACSSSSWMVLRGQVRRIRTAARALARLAEETGALGHPADAGDPDSALGLVDAALTSCGRLDGLVLNAGICRGGAVGDRSTVRTNRAPLGGPAGGAGGRSQGRTRFHGRVCAYGGRGRARLRWPFTRGAELHVGYGRSAHGGGRARRCERQGHRQQGERM